MIESEATFLKPKLYFVVAVVAISNCREQWKACSSWPLGQGRARLAWER